MKKNRAAFLIALAAVAAAVVVGGYLIRRRGDRLPSPESATYEEVVRSFYRGLASLDVGLLDDAKRGFAKATELVPGEPAAWANLALTEIRLGEYDAALPRVQRALALAPSSSDVEFLFGQLETSRGRLDEGIAHLRRAVELDPRGPKPRTALAQEIERAGGQNADAEAQRLYEQILDVRPDNLAALLERARLAAKRADEPSLQDSARRLEKHRTTWPAVAVEQYRALESAVGARNFTDAARGVAFLRNVLVRVPAFRESLVEIKTPSELIAEPFDRFLKLQVPTARPSPPDEALTFSKESLGAEPTTPPESVIAFSPNGADSPQVFAINGGELRRVDAPGTVLPLSGGTSGAPAAAGGLLALDWNRDFKMDLALAGSGGLRLLVQDNDGTFADATPTQKGVAYLFEDASPGKGTRPLFGVWTADIEMDGDLDLVVGVKDGPPVVLRNNGDGSWRLIQPFPGIVGLRAFVWGDFDHDGDPDAALLDAKGDLHVFVNRQAGEFQPLPAPSDARNLIALAVGDVNADGVLDLVTLDTAGSIRRASIRAQGWDEQQVAAWPDPPANAAPGTFRLFLADLDNNGALDLIASGAGRSRVWLAGEKGDLRPLQAIPEAEVFSVIDLNGDGQLDLVGLSDGRPVRLLGRGTKGYHWQVFRPRAQQTAGDQRINSFGVGGDIEIRSGLLTQKQTLTGAAAHFGLGTRTGIDVARIVWPNGIMQADFDTRADHAIVAEQRLKGSCPWVFTYDGAGMRFVTDFLWRSPLGLRINAQDTAGVTQTEDWIKIRGDQLVAKDDAYDVRITAELWETHFVDHVSLMVVDHPGDTEVFVDERFAKQAPALMTHQMTAPRSVPRAWDEAGRDVTDLVGRQDGRYLATFERGAYQGIAQDHFVEFELGQDIRAGKQVWLVANGWIYPTDSSINVAIGQGRQVQPRGLSLEAQDEAGRWVVVDADVGFPAGKNKTILLDLRSVTTAGVRGVHRLRLRTNLEVYWDWLALAESSTRAPLKTKRLLPEGAELRYRGYSQTSVLSGSSNREGPEVPAYDKLANVSERWRDLVGYYTRFGDVRELLARVDDRYVIMNAGDELRLSFAAIPPPEPGWKRDFVLIGDGWVKDGDYNTSFSKTVEPLPGHDRPSYEAAPTGSELEDDPVYRRHPEDWRTYHTRFVTPDVFLNGLSSSTR